MAWQGLGRSKLGEQQFSDDEEMRPRLSRSGVELDMSCPHCSAFSEVVIEWAEVIALANGQSPPGFRRVTTGHEFSVVCPRCVDHYRKRSISIDPSAGDSPERVHAARLRRREISMIRPIGMETVAKWLRAAKAHRFVQ